MMKRLTAVVVVALLVVLLVGACSSSDPGFEKRTMDAGAGSPIDVELVGSSQPMMMYMQGRELPQQISFQFRVSNNSDEPLTVKKIMVYQRGVAAIQMETALRGFDTTLEPGRDDTFTLNALAKQLRPARQGDDQEIVIRAEVTLTNGDTYVSSFEIPIGLAVQ